jgi:hypothetical protein
MNAEDIPGRPLLQDISHYLETNGIIQATDGSDTHHTTYTRLDEFELASKLRAEKEYEEKVLQRFLDEDESNVEDDKSLKERIKVLTWSKGKSIRIKTKSNNEYYNMSLIQMVDQCDVIYSYVHSSQLQSNDQEIRLEFSLEQFDPNAVMSFLKLLGLDGAFIKVQDIPNHEIIECCRIAHFLQCQTLLDEIIDLIKEHIDPENCASICVLADQLEIPTLMHASMSLILERLDDIQNDEVWNEFPSSLKKHIVTLRNAASSSILGRGKKGLVLFSSGDEFLALFSDNIRELKERLRDAKHRQQEIIEERMKRNSGFRLPCDVYGGDVKDAAMKIEKQEARIRTLEAFYLEQKAIFATDEDGTFKQSFCL